MAANLGLVADTTQRHAYELAVGRTRNGLGQRGLADTRRPDQAEHRALELLHTLLHGQVLEDAVLHLFQAVVVGVEHLFGLGQVQAYLARSLPRYIDQPVDVGTHHGRFGRHGRHLLELVQLGGRLGVRILAEASVLDALLEVIDFVVAFVDITQFLLNGLHLLIQVVLALTALHLLLDAATNALLDLQQVDLGIQQGQHMLDACRQIGDFEDFLLLLDLQRHMGGHGIHQPRRLLDAGQRCQHLGRHLLAQLHVLLELAEQAASEHFRLARIERGLVDQRHFGAAMSVGFDETLDHPALLAFDQNLDGTVG